jgi:FixJ family two-component response regulator
MMIPTANGARPVVHVVDDDPSVRTAVGRVLRGAGYEVRGHGSAAEFLARPRDLAPCCAVLDLCLPGASGLEVQRSLAESGEAMPVVFLSGQGDIPATVLAIKAGAVDFLTKPVEREPLLAAVGQALARGVEAHALRERFRERWACYRSLTPRERQVFELVVSGKLNKVIAGELGTAERTVKAHRAQVMRKMQVASLAELVHASEELRALPHPA